MKLNLKRKLRDFQLKEAEVIKQGYMVVLNQMKYMKGYEVFEKVYKQTHKKYKGKIPLESEVEVKGLGLIKIKGVITNDDPTNPEFDVKIVLVKKKGFLKKKIVEKTYKISGNVRKFDVRPATNTKHRIGFLTAILTALNECIFKPIGKTAKELYLQKQNLNGEKHG